MTYSRDTTAISEIAGQPVSTWSGEWQRECEARTILQMSKAGRESFFNGTKDENGKSIEREIIALRGAKAAETLRELMQQILDARARKAQERK